MNPRLAPMNTQAQVLRLAAGQALAPARRGSAPAILTQGELLVQRPAQWLADTVVLHPPVRLVAPAVVDADASSSVIAVDAATVIVPHQSGRGFASIAGKLLASMGLPWATRSPHRATSAPS